MTAREGEGAPSAKLPKLDLALGALALLFGWFSLAYPFGRDQGLFAYIGRAWFERGEIPYRDAIEHKPPGIFVVHGLLVTIFGPSMWPIRLLDLGLLAGIGLACARLVPSANVRGLRGFGVLAAFVFYFGFFGFWDTAQCESVFLALSLAALVVALHGKKPARAFVVSGLLAGAAFMIKPPSMWFLLVALAACLSREPVRRGWLRVTLLFGAGAAVAPLLTVIYFAAHGALSDLGLWLVRVNGYYVQHERGVNSLEDFWLHSRGIFELFEPLSSVLLAGWALAVVRARRRKDAAALKLHALVAALFFAAYASVAMQLKFYPYHCVAFVGPFALLACVLAAELARGVDELGARLARLNVAILAAALLVALYTLSPKSSELFWRGTTHTARYLVGSLSREELTEDFSIPILGYSYHDAELTGRWLAEHTTKDENVAVRGFEPEVYIAASRRYHGRFFWTNFITDPRRSMLHDAWLAEETKQIADDPPRFVVTPALEGEAWGVDWFAARGYREVRTFGAFHVLERGPEGAQPSPPMPPTDGAPSAR